jgi:phage anti-repressor protein
MNVTGKNQSAVKDSRLKEVELPFIQKGDDRFYDARLIHSKLKVATRFNDWLKVRIEEYGFEPNKDFVTEISVAKKKRGGHNKVEVLITMNMAKELCMVERNEEGRKWRRYFIEAEKKASLHFTTETEGSLKGLVYLHTHDAKWFVYTNVLRSIGNSTRSGAVAKRKKTYPGMFFKHLGRINMVHEKFALYMVATKELIESGKQLALFDPSTLNPS